MPHPYLEWRCHSETILLVHCQYLWTHMNVYGMDIGDSNYNKKQRLTQCDEFPRNHETVHSLLDEHRLYCVTCLYIFLHTPIRPNIAKCLPWQHQNNYIP